MKISSNMAATYTIANLNRANNGASAAMKRLSSGLRINSPGDDPAGLAVSNKLDTQLRSLKQASRNVMDGISLVQTAEGALNEVSDMLTRMKELVTQGSSGTYTEEQKSSIQTELDSLNAEIRNICETTQFNKNNLLNTNDNIIIQLGANADQYLEIDGNAINLNQTLNIIEGAKITDTDIQEKVNKASASVSTIRGQLGAYQNRLEHTSNNLGVSEENMTIALSTIQDADMAEEMTNYTNYNVLTQSGIAMLTQANQRPQQVLQLLNS